MRVRQFSTRFMVLDNIIKESRTWCVIMGGDWDYQICYYFREYSTRFQEFGEILVIG